MRSFALVIGVVTAACGTGGTGGTTIAVEHNALGIARVEISHNQSASGRVLAIRGLGSDDQELAVATLRTGMVLYSPEPDVMTPEWHPGTELVASLADDALATLDTITPDREPHQAAVALASPLLAFFDLQAVSKAMLDEAAITFPEPLATTDVAYTATTCSGANFPAAKGNPTECCENSPDVYFKVAVTGLLGTRTLGAACTTSSGSSDCSGTGCTYGPCGGAASGPTGASTAAVFYPTSNPSVCGYDPDPGADSGTPENYTGSQQLYAGVTSSCSYTNCCYQTCNRYSDPEASATCLLVNGEKCSAGSACVSGFCSATGYCAASGCTASCSGKKCGASDGCSGVCFGPCGTGDHCDVVEPCGFQCNPV
jgi:hypothetical protein